MSTPASISDRAYALFRIVAGFLFLCHGLQKMFGLLGGSQLEVGSQLWIGGLLELICGTAICLGIVTPLAAFVASGMMAVAYFQFHWKFQWGADFFPIVNKGEMAVLYCFAFLFMATRGGGPWSLDVKIRKKR